MDQTERNAVDQLFGKLQQLDRQAPQRDAEAEAHIRQQVASLPAAPYYMAQAILVQEQALSTLQSRVQELEQAAAQRPAGGGGGFLGGLFGAGAAAGAPRARRCRRRRGRSRRNTCSQDRPRHRARPGARPAGGGFLAGAMQTAMGVAGGMMIADAISSAFHARPPTWPSGPGGAPVDDRMAADTRRTTRPSTISVAIPAGSTIRSERAMGRQPCGARL